MIFTRFKSRTLDGGICKVPEEITYTAEKGLGTAGAEAFLVLCPMAASAECAFVEFKPDMTLEAKEEIYKVSISPNKIVVSFRDERGGVNGAATVALLLRDCELQCGEILDYPDCTYRSLMLDFARGLPTVEDIYEAIISMGYSKLNCLHLHLMDSKGLCYKSEAAKDFTASANGQFEISVLKDIVSFCRKLKIKIIPEIEIPAHAWALLKAYPEFACDSDYEGNRWTLCPGTDKVWGFFERLVKEVSEIFPDEYIHMGGDELEFAYLNPPRLCVWDTCSKCQALREREGITDRQAEVYYVIDRMNKLIKRYGKKMMMWNDQIDVSKDVPLDRDIFIEFWRIAAKGRGPYEGCSLAGFLEKGFKVLNAYYPYTYCDIETYANLEKLQTWNPNNNPEVPEGYENLVLGGEACAWEFGNYEGYSHYAITLRPFVMAFGDKLWDYSDRIYDDKDNVLMAKYLFGKQPENDVFACIGSILPPRKIPPLKNADNLPDEFITKHAAQQLTYAENLSAEFVTKCAEELETFEDPSCRHYVTNYAKRLRKIVETL